MYKKFIPKNYIPDWSELEDYEPEPKTELDPDEQYEQEREDRYND